MELWKHIAAKWLMQRWSNAPSKSASCSRRLPGAVEIEFAGWPNAVHLPGLETE